MANRWSGVTIDCIDVERVAAFWSALLDRPKGPSQPGWVYLGHPDDAQPRLVFQPVAEPKHGKARVHLDVVVDDIAQGMAQVMDLGGRFTGERHEYAEGVVVVMEDPEEHEFCLCQYY
ncbi:VOC family protein [Streptomyces sp. NBC_00536]|uniref:VOC family protein n=1 Tax=Streptomyces sp. NBC_00536 TaxID=2975769 RepID=UPI002E804825|nr:VOC family protein [Streptomyces sp. NBC_00536]WUC79959.1 VOC family protein [Streptomyces sp. NBC_00536]